MNPSFQFDGAASDPATNYLWDVPSPAYTDILYANDVGIAPPVTYTSLTNSTVTYYWTAESQRAEVSCQAVVRGVTNYAKTFFEVRKPEVNWSLTPISPVAVTNRFDRFGIFLTCGRGGDDTNNAGMLFQYDISDWKRYTNLSSLKMVQLVTTTIHENLASNTNQSRGITTNGLDQTFPFTDWVVMPWPPLPLPFQHHGLAKDSPAEALTGRADFLSRSDVFQSYLLFQPDGGKPVPLKLATWSWVGQARMSTNSPLSYELVPPITSPSASTGTACSVPPTWTNNIDTLTADDSPCWTTNNFRYPMP